MLWLLLPQHGPSSCMRLMWSSFLAVIVVLHVQDHVVEVIVAYQREVVFEYVRIGDRVCRGF